MNHFRKLAGILTALTFLAGLSAHAERMTKLNGPSTGGGGQLAPSLLASDKDVLKALRLSNRALTYVFQYMEVARRPKSDPYRKNFEPGTFAVYDLLFENSESERKNVLDELPTLKYDVREDKGCLHPRTKVPVVASYTAGTKSLCFSLPMILEAKPTVDSINEKIAVLVAHELAHYMGAGDDDKLAIAVENEVKAMIYSNVLLAVDRVEGHVNQVAYELIQPADQILQDIADGEEFSELCRSVDRMQVALNFENSYIDFKGIYGQLYRGHAQALLIGLKWRVSALKVQCKIPKRLDSSDRTTLSFFGNRSEMPMAEYYRMGHPNANHLDVATSRYPLSKPVYHDKTAMEKEVRAIKATAEELLETFHKNYLRMGKFHEPMQPLLKKYCGIEC